MTIARSRRRHCARAGFPRWNWPPQRIARIERHDATLRTFITLTTDQALAQARQADRELAAARRSRPAARHPHRAEGPVLHQRRAHHGGLAHLCGFRAGIRCRGGGASGTAGAVMLGKLNHARAGLRDHFRQSSLRGSAQSLEYGAQSGRVQRRFGRGRGRRHGVHGDGQRYRRLDPHSRVVLRHRRVEAHLRPGQPVRCPAARLQPRSRRTACRGRCAIARSL